MNKPKSATLDLSVLCPRRVVRISFTVGTLRFAHPTRYSRIDVDARDPHPLWLSFKYWRRLQRPDFHLAEFHHALVARDALIVLEP
jgi:hypothetical protein